MTFIPLKASLVALALFTSAGSSFSASAAEPGTIVLAQTDASGTSNSQRIDNVRKFLAAGNNLSRMDDDRLQMRLQRAQKMKNIRNLPADLASGLDKEIADLNAEISKRKSGGSQTSGTSAAAQQKPAASTAAPTDAAPQAGAPTGAASSADVTQFLQSARPAAELKTPELRAQLRKAVQLMKSDSTPQANRQKLRQIVQDARAEMKKRKGGDTAADDGGSDNPSPDSSAQQVQPNPVKPGNTQTSEGDQSDSDSQVAAPDAEQRAKVLLDPQVDARKLSKDELRNRLAAMRQLLASKKLSPETNRALRQRLAAERTILRTEVSQESNSDQSTTNNNTSNQDATIDGNNNSVTNNNVTINNTTNITNNREVVKVVVADRRPSEKLRDGELRRRINVYREVVFDKSYPETERAQLRIILDRDRIVLRDRLLDARRKREADLRARVKAGNLDINVNLDFEPDRRPPRSVFAAEVDDKEIADILAAPPRRKIERRYTVDEVESNPDLRDAVARIEIDTVHFGFGEGFLREEEVGNLDRIAEIMEKILAASPGEIFMIEGHTDAVGSDEANLQLSRERARAVTEALSTYYVIPPENLKPVGYGERYLKIPTQDPEAENRRVSIARITPLVGALQK